jgi:hypothetical protein
MPRQKKIIKEPSSVPTDENVVIESVLEQSVEPIQKVKPVKEKKIREKKVNPPKEEISLPIVQESPSMYSADIGDKILKLIDEKFKAYMPSQEKQLKEEDEIIVVKKKQPKRQPRKKVIYIEDEDKSIDDVVKFNHQDAIPTVQFW